MLTTTAQKAQADAATFDGYLIHVRGGDLNSLGAPWQYVGMQAQTAVWMHPHRGEALRRYMDGEPLTPAQLAFVLSYLSPGDLVELHPNA